MNRAERLAKRAAEVAARGPYKSQDTIPNPPCGRCAKTLNPWACIRPSSIVENTVPYSRETTLDLCPKCYIDLINWLDLEPNA